MPDWLSNFLEYALDFSNVLNASISASWLILAVIGLRIFLKKAPKWVNVALWGIVALRLLMPFSIESAFSLIPSAETVSSQVLQAGPVVGQQSAYLEIVTNPSYGNPVTVDLDSSISSFQIDLMKWTFLWLLGVLVMLIYTAISYLSLRRKLRTAVILRDNFYQSEHVDSPFVLGILNPKIYLPYAMDGQNLHYVVAHEQAHIRRRDHWWKPLGFLLLTIHWFNPLMWVAYILLCRDIELACDEKVIAELGNEQRADYTQALVACAVNRRMIAACPLAFGEVGVKERIKSVMNYKKPAFWVIVLAVTVCLIISVCFLTNPNGFHFNEAANTIASANHFDMRIAGDAVAVEMNPAQISELSSRLAGVKNTKKSNKYGGLTPGYQISAHLEDGSYIRISGYSLSDNEMVDIEWNDVRYAVSDSEFQDYLSRICAGDDTVQALGTFLINQPYGVVQVTYESPHYSFSMVAQENTPEYFIDENLHLYSVKEHSEYPDWTDLGELTEISLTKDNFDKLFTSNSGDGWFIRESASAIRKSTEKAWTVIYDQDKLYYVLQQKNGELYLAYGYYDYSEKDDPGSDDTSIRWLYLLAKHTTNRNIGYSALYSEALIAEAFNVIEKEFGQRFSGSTLLELRYDDAIENRFADIIMNWDLDKGQELITVLTTFEKEGQKESCVWYLVRTEDKKSWEYVSWEFFSKKLSLNDIIILSQKGYDLSWADFEQYEYIETGFGLYIRRYEINDLFHFSIGGAGPNSEPMYMYLGVNGNDLEARIDIRNGDVTEFIEAHHNDTPASSSVKMVPTDTKLTGLQVGALLLPIDGDIYRYLLTDNTGEGVTADNLIYEFKEPDLNRTIEWKVYSLKEYPDLSVVMIISKDEGPWLCTYSPPGRCSDTALSEAINAGYVVMEEGVATHGQDVWKSFYEDAQKGKAASVIVAHYQTLDPKRCDTAYFEAFNQDYPSLNLYHLNFDGTTYTLSFTDSGLEYTRTYEYLIKYEASGTPLVGNTEPKRIVHYALTHDTTHSWEELWGSLASSAFPAPIDFYTIYSENVK